jgi:hypothetical protein
VPLLPSTAAAVDLEPGGRMAGELLEDWPPHVGKARGRDPCSRRNCAARGGARAASRTGDHARTRRPRLLRYLAWTATARFLRPW